MAEFKLTENQAAAVYDRSGTLLVAAAAGSGKTAILTKRILEKLTDENEACDISEFLVVTFTKAATGELRSRLYKELSEYIKKNPKNTRARRQLSLVNLAKISTIHSFCYDLIKQNFESLSLPATLRIGEQTELDVLLYNTLEELVSENYESDGDSSLFLKAVEVLSVLLRASRIFTRSFAVFPSHTENTKRVLRCTESLRNAKRYSRRQSALL